MKLLVSLADAGNQLINDYLLQSKEVNATFVENFEEIFEYATSYEYDAIINDSEEFLKDCERNIEKIRRTNAGIPLIFIYQHGTYLEEEIIRYFDAGFDNIILHHLPPGIFLAKVRAIVRRSKGLHESTIWIGNIKIDLSKHEVHVDNHRVDLSNKEQCLIECLALNKGKILSKESLLEYIYGGIHEPEIRIIDAFIWRIRRKLGIAGQKKDYMQTIWGRGYRLSDEEDEGEI